MKDFRNSVVVVTGAGSGIGREIAHAFADRGARLALCDIDGERLRGVKAELELKSCNPYTEVVDVSRAWQVKEFCENTFNEMGRVDILCNNAGVVLWGLLEDMSIEDWEWIIGVNLWGVVHGCHFFYPRMIKQGGGGNIVNISSIAGLGPMALMTAYCSTKSAVLALSETLRGEAALHGIGVSAICPCSTSTNLVKGMRLVSGKDGPAGKRLFKKMDERLARKCSPEKIAAAVLRAVERDSGVVPFGYSAHLLSFAHRACHPLLDLWLKAYARLAYKMLQ